MDMAEKAPAVFGVRSGRCGARYRLNLVRGDEKGEYVGTGNGASCCRIASVRKMPMPLIHPTLACSSKTPWKWRNYILIQEDTQKILVVSAETGSNFRILWG